MHAGCLTPARLGNVPVLGEITHTTASTEAYIAPDGVFWKPVATFLFHCHSDLRNLSDI